MTSLLSPDALPALRRLASDPHASADDQAGEVCRAVRALLGVEVAAVTRLSGSGMRVVAVEDGPGLGLAGGTWLTGPDALCREAMAGRAPDWTTDLPGTAHAASPLVARLGLRSFGTVPLLDASGAPVGTVCVLDRRATLPGEDGREVMRLFAGTLSRCHELDRVRARESAARRALRVRARRLADSEGRFRSLLDEMRDIVVRLGPDGRVQYVNPAWTELTGVPVADVIGTDGFERVHPDDLQTAAEHHAEIVAGADGPPRQVRFLAGDGGYRWMRVKGRAVHEDGEVAGFTGILEDVTDQHRAQEQVRQALHDAEQARDQAQAALAEAERASVAKSEFLSRMSHELRTPLNAILGFGQLLEMSPLSGEDAEHVGLILRSGRHLLELINEVLDVVRIESGHLPVSLEHVPVAEVLSASLDLVRVLAAQHELRIEAPALHREAVVVADAQRLTQVLVNLLSNAVKYNRPGGRIHVDTTVLPAADTPDGEEGWLRIGVTDTGAGIPPDRLSQAFAAFARLGAENTGIEGSGIGLSLSRTLTEAMGGRIGATSTPGTGSTFYVDLPCVAVSPPDVPNDPAGPGRARTRTVLYVEDNPSNVTLVRHVLARRPHLRVHVAGDGVTGLTEARTLAPDLLLLDLHLPGLSGAEVLRELRASPDQRLRSLPVVVLTADLTPGVEQRMLDDGATAFLGKPIDVHALLAAADEFAPSPTKEPC